MDQFFKDPQTRLRLHDGPLDPYIDSYAAEMRAEGYAQQTAEIQIRLAGGWPNVALPHRRLPLNIFGLICERGHGVDVLVETICPL